VFKLDLPEIAGAISATLEGGRQGVFGSVCTDSRAVNKGALFFALCGERFDGHQFAQKAVEQGAAGVVAQRRPEGLPPGVPLLLVKDTLAALQDLARYNRQKFTGPLVGVTGSSGKTSTKDLIYSVISAGFRTLKTEGNLNNEVGLPLTLLRIDQNCQAAVVEMAMRGMGEIDLLGGLALPSGAVITNIGEAHFELLGSVDNIARAKGEILDHVPEQGFAVLHGDSPYMRREARRCRGRVIFFGEDPGFGVSLKNAVPEAGGNRFTASVRGREEEFFVPLPGRHNVINSLAAIAVGLELGLDLAEVRKGLAGAHLTALRLEISHWNGLKIINDSYNANPSSTRAAIQVLGEAAGEGSRKIAVLGDMLELGEKSDQAHREVGRAAREAGVHLLVAVGERAGSIGLGAREAGLPARSIHYCRTAREAAGVVRQLAAPGDVILVKGSRGMKMEEFVTALQEDNR